MTHPALSNFVSHDNAFYNFELPPSDYNFCQFLPGVQGPIMSNSCVKSAGVSEGGGEKFPRQKTTAVVMTLRLSRKSLFNSSNGGVMHIQCLLANINDN